MFLRSLLRGRLFLFFFPGVVSWWPFEDDNAKGRGSPPVEMEGMHFAFGGAPRVIVVENHFGSDPWEDLHANMHQLIGRSAEQGQLPMLAGPAASSGNAVALPFEMQLGSLLSAFGDEHAGHFGRAEGGFQVDDDHVSRFRITAQLPGYKFGKEDHLTLGEGDAPLSVRAVGRRSLVVKGMQRTGPMIREWQRSFAVPKGCDLKAVSVTYSSTSGNLTVDVPRRNITDADDREEEREEQDDIDEMMPPALRALQGGMPAILGQLTAPGMPQQGGFLMPAQDIGSMLADVFGQMDQLHPRFQLPEGGDRPVPEDADVNLVGCFAESQLDKVQLKYYGEANAASFNAMYWHAQSDHVPYFAMARHQQALGHAFTAHGFVHEVEKPQWGSYDGCGSRCADDDSRWCGCANEGERGFGNGNCPTQGEKRFAVYKIGVSKVPEQEQVGASTGNATEPQGQQNLKSTESAKAAPQSRPYWQLDDSGNSSNSPSIEIRVPKGTVAQARGREVLLYNASEQEPQAATVPPTPQVQKATEGDEKAAASAASAAADVSPSPATPAKTAPTATPSQAAVGTPVGKMRLPVGVSPDACNWDSTKSAEDGSHVIRCTLDREDVRRVPIKVIDEL